MAPIPVVNRGFGGATMEDVVRHVDRIVMPYEPRATVLHAGVNDIAGARPKPPDRVAEAFGAFVRRVLDALPDSIVFYVAIAPTPGVWRVWSTACEVNRLIHEQVAADSRLRFVDLGDLLLDEDGRPNTRLYNRSGHPNDKGYTLWASRIKQALDQEASLQGTQD